MMKFTLKLRRSSLQEKTKTETYIGFSVRSRKCKIGVNAVATLKKAELVLVCSSASENTKNEAQKLAQKLRCEIIILGTKLLAEMVHKENAKVMAITDKALAKAIIENAEKDLKGIN